MGRSRCSRDNPQKTQKRRAPTSAGSRRGEGYGKAQSAGVGFLPEKGAAEARFPAGLGDELPREPVVVEVGELLLLAADFSAAAAARVPFRGVTSECCDGALALSRSSCSA